MNWEILIEEPLWIFFLGLWGITLCFLNYRIKQIKKLRKDIKYLKNEIN